MVYRVRQFIWAICAKLTEADYVFIDEYLNSRERALFMSLPKFEQAHSLNVARDVLEEAQKKNLYDELLIKAALLHDIGKINKGLNIYIKSILVIMDKLFPEFLKRFTWNKQVNAYYNHPEMAMELLEGEDGYIKYLIKNHHNYDVKEDEKLKILQYMDLKN
jgi:putative nucleotidyltransferase with HDIG domain